ncbi:MAG: hypothetical protein KJ955_03835 [Nanoarchaeota archaeon]|nr:hypothetical protein [Nanoarchaeota archaeon]
MKKQNLAETIEIDDEQETAKIEKAITQMERAADLKEIETAKFTAEDIMGDHLISVQQCIRERGLMRSGYKEVSDGRQVLEEGGVYNFYEDPIKWGCSVSPLDRDYLPYGRQRYCFEECLALEGICEDVSIRLFTRENGSRGAHYQGIVRRDNGERVPFSGYGILEAKAIRESAEKKIPVDMFCTLSAKVVVNEGSMWKIESIHIDDRVRITNNFDPQRSGGDIRLAK